ncbi:hypothetical protein [Phyllobacterium sp. YR531]|uniref:hypothetical protein n=1 Tax=Phyllobacterium sp. YR531 TaxID=1144343 RepID=UPI0002E7F06E|nr:hypothetical protein [Phyllobacterium sp. YR531]
MPDDQSEEPPSPDLRSKLILQPQHQQQKPVNFPHPEFARVAGGFVLSLTAFSLATPRSHFIR